MTALTDIAAPQPITRRLQFDLPSDLEASVPPEARGITRDAVRLMVAYQHDGRLVQAHFNELPRFLDAGDLVVVNTSGTLAAALDATAPDGQALGVHLSTQLPAGLWVVELRKDGGPFRDAASGWVLRLPASGEVELLAPYGAANGRLWIATLRLLDPLHTYLAVHGRPI